MNLPVKAKDDKRDWRCESNAYLPVLGFWMPNWLIKP